MSSPGSSDSSRVSHTNPSRPALATPLFNIDHSRTHHAPPESILPHPSRTRSCSFDAQTQAMAQNMVQAATQENCMLKELLTTTTVKQLLEGGDSGTMNHTGHKAPTNPVCLDSHLTVQEGCAALSYHKISSAPVYDEAQGGFVGMLDFKDLVTYVLEVFRKVPRDKAHAGFNAEMEVTDIVKLALANHQGVPVKFISNLSKSNPMIPVHTTSTLNQVARDLVKNKAHRVVVIQAEEDGNNKFLGVLSQSTLAAFVVSKVGKLAVPKPAAGAWPFGDKTVQELGLVRGGVVTVDPSDAVLDALHLMHEKKVSSVAIVESAQGAQKLIGNISMTDMKEILSTRGAWKKLYEPVQSFFSQVRSRQGLEANGNDRAPSFLIHPTTTLVSAMEKMAATRSHRLWVVENGDRLVGVLSLSDIMPFLAY